MKETIKLLCEPDFKFSIGDEHVRADQLSLEQAKLIAAQFPDQYVIVGKGNAVPDTNK